MHQCGFASFRLCTIFRKAQPHDLKDIQAKEDLSIFGVGGLAERHSSDLKGRQNPPCNGGRSMHESMLTTRTVDLERELTIFYVYTTCIPYWPCL